MNKQELIERIEGLKNIFGNKTKYIEKNTVIELVSKLDEPEKGHADEAPRYFKNILARLRELPLHDREVWLKAIMSEFEKDFSHAKWREGYEQGKLEGMVEREKVKVPQFVADWIKVAKPVYSLSGAMIYGSPGVNKWLENEDNQRIFAQAWFDGYEKEKRYRISMPKTRNHKNHAQILCEKDGKIFWCGEWYPFKTKFTRKELEEANFGWMFDCEGIEIEEVE